MLLLASSIVARKFTLILGRASLIAGLEYGMEWWNGMVEWNGECTQL